MSEMRQALVETTVSLLGKPYSIKCSPEQQQALSDAAHYLDKELRHTREAGIVGLDRIVIITALNIVNDYLQDKRQKEGYVHDLNARVSDLQSRIDEVLTSAEQLELE